MENEKFVDDFLTMEYWLNDNIPLSGQVYKQFVEDCFHKNLLIQNKMYLGSHRVDLTKITCPVLSIVAEQDHLVHPCSSEPINQAVGSKDTELMTFPSGHIGLSVSSRAMKSLWPEVGEWLAERSQKAKTPPAPKASAAKVTTTKTLKKKPATKTTKKKK
jgi:polyhydroxyalkanoate synthase